MTTGNNVTTEEYESTLTVANAVQLSVNVTREISGNDVADTIGGEPINTALLSSIYAAKIAGYIKGEG